MPLYGIPVEREDARGKAREACVTAEMSSTLFQIHLPYLSCNCVAVMHEDRDGLEAQRSRYDRHAGLTHCYCRQITIFRLHTYVGFC